MATTNNAHIDEAYALSTSDKPNPTSPNTFNTKALDVIKILLADENPNNPLKTKSSFKQIQCPIQTHRVTEITDLSESLKSNDWDLIIAYSSSAIFTPAVIQSQVEQATTPITAIYLDDHYAADKALQVMQLGFNDYLASHEEDRILFSILRETRSIRDHRSALTADASLKNANATNKLLLDSTTDAIAYITDGVIIHANHAFINALQFESTDDIEWQPFIDLIAPDNQSSMRNILKNLGTDNKEQQVKVELINAQQQIIETTLSFAAANFDGEACTQIILCNDNSPQAIEQPNQDDTATAVITEISDPQSQDISLGNALTHIEKLSDKGAVFFAAIDNIASVKKLMGLDKHVVWLDHLTNIISESIQDHAILLDRVGESWIFATPNDVDIKVIAEALCEKVAQHFKASSDKPDCQFSLGASKFGIAELSPIKALHKAFTACASQQLRGGGYKIISPRIDNAQASDALASALELGRLRVKYQPIVGLHNQGTHLYDVYCYIENDAGREQPASSLIAQLGTEKKNTLLDQWLITAAVKDLQEQPADKDQLCLTLPLTTSSLVDDTFIDWLTTFAQTQNIICSKLCFSLTAEQIVDYEEKATLLFGALSKLGFYTAIFNCEHDHSSLISSYKPKFIQLSSHLTKQLSGQESKDAQDSLKHILSAAREIAGSCISSEVDSAAELAQLWQTGIPYVQGSYLQGPMPTMSYEFSDIG